MKKFLIVLLILAIIGGIAAYLGYNAIFSPNVLVGESAKTIYIPSGADYQNVTSILKEENIVKDFRSFDYVARFMKYKDGDIKAGKYTIEPGWNNKELISVLRSGRQTPVKVTFNNLRTKEDLAGKISSYLELDSLTLTTYFQDAKLHEQYGLDDNTFITLFIPNTYEFFWTTKKEEIVKRFANEHEKFWNQKGRLKKAKEKGLTPTEVYTLASIVEKESLRSYERPIIAGLYLNRLERGVALQADPTVVFANGDFGLRRVLLKHLEIDSPYNTYKYAGLPPGPIYMPSIFSIDAVLDPKDHNYMYMCASPEVQGEHLFAESLSQHNANARKYHRWLNERGIR